MMLYASICLNSEQGVCGARVLSLSPDAEVISYLQNTVRLTISGWPQYPSNSLSSHFTSLVVLTY